MQIVKDTNNVVVWAGDDFEPKENIWFNDHIIEDVDSVPPDFCGGHYTYNGSWDRTPLGGKCLVKMFERAKAFKQTEINNLFNTEIATIKGHVMQGEIDSFDTQEREAVAFIADNTAIVPLLAGLAVIRGITVVDLANRVVGHAEAYRIAIATTMGKKHKFEDQIKLATTLEDLEAIEVT